MKRKLLSVNIRARKSESTIESNNQSFTIHKDPTAKNVNFPIQTEKGVKNLLQNKLLKNPLATIMGSVSILLTEPVFAEGIMGDTQASQMTSGDFIEFFIKATIYLNVAVIGTSIMKPAIIHFVNFFSPSMAENMANRLVNGLGMTLYWQMIVIAMVYLAHLLLGSSPYYIDPWVIISPHIKPAILDVVNQFKQ